ncbi:MAG: hypothetical protein ABWJ42_03125 [Sulfolobales archaeon]
MISRDYLFNTLLALFVGVSVWSLWSLGESRLDAYISLIVLEYLVLKSIVRPRRVSRDWLAVALILIFIVIASLRIYLVLL